MRVVIQRVSQAQVVIDEIEHARIAAGLVLFLGIEETDGDEDIDWICRKITQLRIFNDDMDKMNLSVQDIQGSFLVISQFTLHASTKKGNRPSFIKAAKPDVAIPLYERFIGELTAISGLPVKSGVFAAHMHIGLINDGPVTILMDSKQRT